MAKMGRPQKEINAEEFKKLCGLQCTLNDIAGFFDCSADTIERWCKRTYNATFADIYKMFSATGKVSLRRNQFELSKKSAAMAIWLGKQYLDQKDSIALEHNSDGQLAALIDGLKEPDKTEE